MITPHVQLKGRGWSSWHDCGEQHSKGETRVDVVPSRGDAQLIHPKTPKENTYTAVAQSTAHERRRRRVHKLHPGTGNQLFESARSSTEQSATSVGWAPNSARRLYEKPGCFVCSTKIVD